MRFYATLPMGLEDISALEIKRLGGKIREIKKRKGRVFFDGKKELISKLNFLSRTLERVLILLDNRKISKLEDIYRAIKSLDFSFIRQDQSFAIRSLRVGEHSFTSMDISREAGQAVIDSYLRDKKTRLKVNLDNPDIMIRVDLIYDELFVGLDTTGDMALHKRWYRVYNHPAPINTSIASSMIMLSGWKKGKILFDPMCGGGTIPIESAMMLRNIPPGKNREFAYYKFMGKIYPYYMENSDFSPIFGSDRFKKHIDGALRNAEMAGVKDTINFFHEDISNLKEIEANFVITNPPYGLRIGGSKMIDKLYKTLFEKISEILIGESVLVLITPHKSLIENLSKDFGFKILERKHVKYGNLDTTIFKLSI